MRITKAQIALRDTIRNSLIPILIRANSGYASSEAEVAADAALAAILEKRARQAGQQKVDTTASYRSDAEAYDNSL